MQETKLNKVVEIKDAPCCGNCHFWSEPEFGDVGHCEEHKTVKPRKCYWCEERQDHTVEDRVERIEKILGIYSFKVQNKR